MAESKYYGLYQGVVTNIQDPEQRGRIKVKCPDVLGGSTQSAWCDPIIEVAYDGGGDFCMPSVGETVWLQFIAGDANRPVYMGGWWSKSKTPLGTNYTKLDQVRIINYADCTITMQDGMINLNVGEGLSEIMIEKGIVTIKGDLIVEGSISAEQTVEADIVKAQTTVEADKANILTLLEAEKVQVNTTIEADEIEATTSVIADGISLTEHTHEDVMTGEDESGKPVKEE